MCVCAAVVLLFMVVIVVVVNTVTKVSSSKGMLSMVTVVDNAGGYGQSG